jgi:DNA polymerase-3 subunit gamma/tau
VGQSHVVKTLENALKNNRVHHAFLFTGTRGVGKTTSARILAKTLNCESLQDLNPCDVCSPCKSVSSGNSLDVLEIDGASHTGVDDVRAILEQIVYAPMYGKYRIIVIDEVHMLSNSAFNALLKTLEEPPAHAVFIFATTESHKVPQTILSRVQRFDFRRIHPKDVADRMRYICGEEKIKYDEEALALLSEKADGSMRDALTYFDQVLAFCGNAITVADVREVLGIPAEELYQEVFEAIREHDTARCFMVVDDVLGRGIEVENFCDGLVAYMRDLLACRSTKLSGERLGMTEERRTFLAKLAEPFGPGDLLRLSRILTDMRDALRGSPQPRITLEVTLARMAWLDRASSVRDLLKQVSHIAEAATKKT